MEARTIPPTLGLTLSIAALRQPYRACDIFLRGAELDRLMGRKVPDDEEIPLSIWAGLPSTYAPYDLIWGLKYPLSAVDAVGTRVLLGALYYVAIRHLTLVPDRHKERAQRAIEATGTCLVGGFSPECKEEAEDAVAAILNEHRQDREHRNLPDKAHHAYCLCRNMAALARDLCPAPASGRSVLSCFTVLARYDLLVSQLGRGGKNEHEQFTADLLRLVGVTPELPWSLA